jgi:hypothetical protein
VTEEDTIVINTPPATPEQVAETLRSLDWGVELAVDGAWIARSRRQDLLALSAEALVCAAPIVIAEPCALDAIIAQLARLPGALRLDPVPLTGPPWPSLPSPLMFGHHRGARSVEAPLHIWRPTPRGRSKQRHVTFCGIVMTEAPGVVNLAAPGLRLCRDCGRVLAAIRMGATQTPEPPKPAELHGWAWEQNTRTIGALGYWRLCNRAVGFATSDVPDPQEAVGRALIKLRQLLCQATRAGMLEVESAAEVLRAYGWPVEQAGGSWRLTGPDAEQVAVEDAVLIRAARALRVRPGRTFDELIAASAQDSPAS